MNFQNLTNQAKLKALGLQDYDVREMLYAPEGRVFLISDYAAIELSILAALSGDENLIDQILKGDAHSYVANTLFGDEIEKILGERITKANRKEGKHKIVRDEFKRVSYAICYGTTGWNIFRTCGPNLLQVGIHITRELTDSWVERWKHELFPKTGALFEENARKAVTQFYTQSILGRRRYWNETEVRSDLRRYYGAMREGMNQPIQSTSADMTKLAMQKVDRTLDWRRGRIVASIHDELLLEVDEDYVSEGSALVKYGMESAGHQLLAGFPEGLVIAEPKVSKLYNK